MSQTSQDTLELAMALPEVDRLDIAAALLAACEPPMPEPAGAEWVAEISRRSDEIDRDSVECLTWEQVKQASRSRRKQ